MDSTARGGKPSAGASCCKANTSPFACRWCPLIGGLDCSRSPALDGGGRILSQAQDAEGDPVCEPLAYPVGGRALQDLQRLRPGKDGMGWSVVTGTHVAQAYELLWPLPVGPTSICARRTTHEPLAFVLSMQVILWRCYAPGADGQR